MMGSVASGIAADRPVPACVSDFASWMAAEQRRIFLLCHRLLQDPDEASSATQDVFLKAYRALGKSESDQPEEPARWLARIAVNTCLDRLRSKRWQIWRRRGSPEHHEETLVSLQPSAEDRVFADQIQVRLGRAMEKLSLRQRAVFTLKHYEDRSLEEIAAILDLDVGSVKSHMFRATSKLRNELRDLYLGKNDDGKSLDR
jgi:RNA polymerase sigma factor, sigma-70 family